MKRKKSNEKADWEKAHSQAIQMGVLLTRRKNSKGEYICYLNPKARRGWFGLL